MNDYSYEAVNDVGAVTRGRLQAGDEQQLRRLLEQRGLTLVRLLLSRGTGTKQRSLGRVPTRELAEFSRYVALTTKAGLSVVDCIEDFASHARNPAMRRTLARIVADVRGGSPLAEAFARHPRAFDATFVSMVRAGESSGTLEAALHRVADQIEFQSHVRTQLKSALLPPVFLLVALGGLVVLLLTFLLPRLVASMSGTGVVMPLPTRVVISISDALRAHGTPLLGGLVGAVVLLRLLMLSPGWRLRINAIWMRLPVIGPLMRMSAEARFASTMSGLLSSGIDAVHALQMAAETTGAPALRGALLATASRVEQGQSLNDALVPVRGLHPLLLRMLQLGERAGNLDHTLGMAAEFYSAEIPRRVKRALQILEPSIVIGAGGTVAFIVLATILPIFSLYDSIDGG
jgi:type II secretory pathway component PulF